MESCCAEAVARVYVSATGPKLHDHVMGKPSCRHMDWASAKTIFGVGIRSVPQEQLGQFHIRSFESDMQGRTTYEVTNVNLLRVRL
jgi:hypothetical protein